MKNLLAFILALTVSIPSFAQDQHKKDSDKHFNQEKVRHFDVKEPKTVKDALATYDKYTASIAKLAKNKDYAKAHEESYNLMAAGDALNEKVTDKKLSSLVSQIAETSFEVHEASENGNGKDIEKNLKKLNDELKQLKKGLKA